MKALVHLYQLTKQNIEHQSILFLKGQICKSFRLALVRNHIFQASSLQGNAYRILRYIEDEVLICKSSRTEPSTLCNLDENQGVLVAHSNRPFRSV